MADTTPYEFEIDGEVLDAGSEGYSASGSSGKPRIESVKGGDVVTVYFVTDPDTGRSQGDWIAYREVAAFQGFKGGIMLPDGYKEFPVYDQEMVRENGELKRRYRRNPDGSPADWLLAQVAPPTKFKTKSGRAEGRDKLAVNIVDTEGVHKVLKFSGMIGRDLRKTFNQNKKINPGFTFTDRPWKLAIIGKGASQELAMEPLDQPYPDDYRVEPLDLREVLDAMRRHVENYHKEAQAQNTATFDDESDPWEDAGEYTTVDPEESEYTPSGLDEFDPWKDVTSKDLRAMLDEAGVEVPARATKSAMARLALENGVTPPQPAAATA